MPVSKENADRVVGTVLDERVADVVSRAADALATMSPPLQEEVSLPEGIVPAWQAIVAQLEHGPPGQAGQAAALCELLVEVTQVRQDLREREVSDRLDTLGRIHSALSRLGDLRTPSELIDAVPEEVCSSCRFDRAVISRVRGSTWVPEALHVQGAQDPTITANLRDYLKTVEIPLSSMLMETEMVRRGTPALVDDPLTHNRTFKDLMTVSQTTGYVAAPIMPAGRVIGFLHADCFATQRELTTRDRDNMWAFAEGFGLVFERVVLLQRLMAQRKQVRDAFRSAEGTIDELCDAQLELDRTEREPVQLARPAAPKPSAQESRLHALLTPREREVLALMASGATNSQIADQLVISQGTVKSHVKHVLRKLRASTRAEAVSRSLHLSMGERP